MPEKKGLFTDDELVYRIWDKEEIKDLMARHSYYYSNEQRREEISELWVQEFDNRKTASYGRNTGFYVGMDEVVKYYVIKHNEDRYKQLKAHGPDIEATSLNLGYGALDIHTLNTPLVIVADDGRTAKFMGYDCGIQSVGKPDGTADAYYVFGLVYADLIREGDDWKIWHLFLQHDHTIPAGVDYSSIDAYMPQTEDPIINEFGSPTVERVVYDPFYGWEYLYQDMPRAYYSYESRKGYGPDSDMGYKYNEREARY